MLKEPKSEKYYIAGVLYKFLDPDYKVAIDKDGEILDEYYRIAADDHNIATWIDYMAMDPSTFEPLCNLPKKEFCETIELFLYVASKIPSKPKLVVYSLSSFIEKYDLDDKENVSYGNKKIKIFDRDKAVKHFSKTKKNVKKVIKNSVVAEGGSNIERVKK